MVQAQSKMDKLSFHFSMFFYNAVRDDSIKPDSSQQFWLTPNVEKMQLALAKFCVCRGNIDTNNQQTQS